MSSASFLIFVKSLDGRTLALDVTPHETVSDLKHKIYENNGVHPNQQRLVFSGKNLNDTLTLESYGIQTLSSVWMMMHKVVG